MLQYLGYLIFILSVALAAGGIVLSTRLRNKYHDDTFSSLLYFQVFICTFGFYGIWGQVIIKALLSRYISPENMVRIADIALLLGLPFLVIAWLMLLQFSSSITGRSNRPLFITAFLAVNFSALAAIGYYISQDNDLEPAFLMKSYYVAMNFLYSSAASGLILFRRSNAGLLNEHDSKTLASFIFMIMLMQCVPLLFYKSELWIAIIFVFVFFAGNSFIPVYLSYAAKMKSAGYEPLIDITFEDFLKKFDVSPRETDIIREICNGLSNKEIAEKLFITLQTVKDHTHRIYIKTNVRSRSQLIMLVKGMKIP